MRGPATRHKTANRNANVITSQKIWLGKVSVLNGGKPAPSGLAGTSVEEEAAIRAYVKSMINAMTRPNRPVASQSAKPRSKFVVCDAAAPGLRSAPDR